MSVLLSAVNVSCGYGGRDIVKNISFSVNGGEILSIAGKNGCGKTTLLRCLCGLIPCSSGNVSVDGENIPEIPRREAAKLCALFSQTSAGGTFGSYTVYDTVMLGRYPYMHGVFASPSAEDREVVSDCLKRTGTESLSHRRIGELSGGQLQRVFLAKAFAQQPKVMLLDEPANHIDLSGQPELIRLMHDWITPERAIIAVFHDLNLCAAASDRMLLIDGGKKIIEGKCADVCRSAEMSSVYGFDIAGYMREMLSFWDI